MIGLVEAKPRAIQILWLVSSRTETREDDKGSLGEGGECQALSLMTSQPDSKVVDE